MIKELIDKQKAKRKLLEFYYMCNKKRKYILYKGYDGDQYDKIQQLQHAIAYILYKDFNCRNFDIVWDYDYRINDEDMEEYLYQLRKTSNEEEFDLLKPLKGEVTDKQYGIIRSDGKYDCGYITNLQKGNVYYDIENHKCYMFDGKNLVEMC